MDGKEQLKKRGSVFFFTHRSKLSIICQLSRIDGMGRSKRFSD